MAKMRGKYQFPDGLHYFPNFLSLEEETNLLQFAKELEFQKVIIFDQEAKRTVAHFGFHYNYDTATIVPGIPFPPILLNLRDKCADIANIPREKLVQCLFSYYPVGAPIGWHKDKFMFGPKVLGVSLLSPCVMRFQRTVDEQRFVYEQELMPRSAYILSGKARYDWEHSIPPVREERYSITFRSLA
jgi:alkylated DNA repair protein (DNA oxidative demethylase)